MIAAMDHRDERESISVCRKNRGCSNYWLNLLADASSFSKANYIMMMGEWEAWAKIRWMDHHCAWVIWPCSPLNPERPRLSVLHFSYSLWVCLYFIQLYFFVGLFCSLADYTYFMFQAYKDSSSRSKKIYASTHIHHVTVMTIAI